MSNVAKSPIVGFYILDTSGIPLMARHYQGTLSEHEAVLLGGFFSAIELFTRNTLKSELTDIGILGKRFYFTITMDKYIQILIIESYERSTSDHDYLSLIDLIQYRVGIALEIVKEVSAENNLDPDQIIKGFGNCIDSLVFESTLEKIEKEADYEMSMKQGQAINYAKIDHNEVLEKIKSLLS